MWGSTDVGVRDILDPIEALLAREYPDFTPPPFGQQQWIHVLVRHIMLAEPMVDEFAALFAGVDADRAVELAGAFSFGNTVERHRLAAILKASVDA